MIIRPASSILVCWILAYIITSIQSTVLNAQVYSLNDENKIEKKSTVLDISISIKIEKTSFRKALQLISKAAKVNFIYSDVLVQNIDSISCNFKETKLSEILDIILKNTRITYFQSKNNTIVLVRNKFLQEKTGAFSGVVTDANSGKLLAAVNLILNETSWGAASDTAGYYRIEKLPEGKYTLITSSVGYKTKVIKGISVINGEISKINIPLQPIILELDEIIVTGNKTPTSKREMGVAVSVIDSEQIERQEARSLTDLFRGLVPGVYHLDGDVGLGGSIRIRGISSLRFPSRAIAYYIDGIPVNGEALSELNLDNIERVEIVRGPNATTLYGVDASEGVIQMFTKKGSPGTMDFSLSAAQGIAKTDLRDETPKTQEYSVSLSGTTNIFSYSLFGRYYDADGILPNNHYNSKSYTASISSTLNKFNISIIGRYISSNQCETLYNYRLTEVFTGGFNPEATLGKKRIMGGVNVSFTPFNFWLHNLFFGLENISSYHIDPVSFRYTSGDSLKNEHETKSISSFIGYNTTLSYSFNKDIMSTLTVGLEYFYRSNEEYAYTRYLQTGSVITDNESRSPLFRNAGYYIQEKLGLWDKLFLTAGLRFEDNSYFGENSGISVNPRFSVSTLYYPVSWWIIKPRLSLGRAIKAPPEQRGLYNPELKPEENSGWEIGADNYFFNGNLQCQLTYFNQLNKDLIVQTKFIPEGQTESQLQYDNLGEISNKGWEFAVTYSAGDMFRCGGTYSCFNNEIQMLSANALDLSVETNGVPVNGAAKDAGSLYLFYQATKAFSIYADMYYVGKRKAYLQNALGNTDLPRSQQYLEPFAKLNLVLRYRFSEYFGLFGKVNNLFNSKVDELELKPAPQQSIVFGVKVNI